MAIVLVTYDLKKPGRNYQPVFDYLKRFSHCKGMESVWLLDTTISPASIRDALNGIVDGNDIVFVTKITPEWAARNYDCGHWLNKPERNWH